MPNKSQDNGIVIINGTSYSVKTGLPVEKGGGQNQNHQQQNTEQVQRQPQTQSMTDLSGPQADRPRKIDIKTEKDQEKKDTKQVSEQNKTLKKRTQAARAQQFHTIKEGSGDQVLDLRKSARAKKLANDREQEKNTPQTTDKADKQPVSLKQAGGVGPNQSQNDTQSRLERASKHQKSSAINKFFPDTQPASNRDEVTDVDEQSEPVTKEGESTKQNEQSADNSLSTNTPVEAPVQRTPQPLKQNIQAAAQTREDNKLAEKHPRYVASSETRNSAPQNNTTETYDQAADNSQADKVSFWSLFTHRPRITSYVAAGTAAVVLIGFVAYLNLPQMALKVAANRAGFEATMPAYKPGGFSFDGPISYAPGQIVISFRSNADDRNFELIQRKTTWDSTSLLENYVARESEDYLPMQQNGLTVYIFDGNNAAWVDSGIWYTIKGNSQLSSDQLLKMAASL